MARKGGGKEPVGKNFSSPDPWVIGTQGDRAGHRSQRIPMERRPVLIDRLQKCRLAGGEGCRLAPRRTKVGSPFSGRIRFRNPTHKRTRNVELYNFVFHVRSSTIELPEPGTYGSVYRGRRHVSRSERHLKSATQQNLPEHLREVGPAVPDLASINRLLRLRERDIDPLAIDLSDHSLVTG